MVETCLWYVAGTEEFTPVALPYTTVAATSGQSDTKWVMVALVQVA